MLPYKPTLRQRLHTWNGLRKLIGPVSTFEWFLIRMGKKLADYEPGRWRVHPRPLMHPVTMRLRGSSDQSVFSQTFQEGQYSPLRDFRDVSLVLDLGANIGMSSAWFLSCFPAARVVAVEPDRRNVELCKRNLQMYGDRVLLLHGAVWSECTKLCLSQGSFGDGREWASQVMPVAGGDVEAWDVGRLIEMAGGGNVDLLKVDIERAELAVFGETSKAWLPRVRNICIELHGPDCEAVFFNALSGFDYELGYSHNRELTICRNLRLKDAAV